MICKNCGFENNDNANFCANCGSDLRDKDQETVQDSVQPEETLITDAEEVPADQGTAQEETGFILVDSTEPAAAGEDSLLQTVSAQTERLKEEENTAKEEEPVLREADAVSSEEPVKWYYVDKGQSRGPFDEELFEEMAANGTIGGKTYIWKPGMENWALLEDTDFGKSLIQARSQAESQEQDAAADPLASLEEKNRRAREQEDSLYFQQNARTDSVQEASAEPDVQDAAGSEWFYVQNSRSSGPYADEVMGQFVRNGLIDANTYVWKEGMSDWQHLGNTALSRYLPRSSQNQTSYGTGAPRPQSGWNTQSSGPYAPCGVKEHSVILYLVLYFCTCSLFNLFWIYQMAKDVDALAAGSNRPRGVDPVLAVILDVVTCGLFKVYFYWKEGTVLSGIMNQPGTDQSVLLAVLGFFCPVAASAILQDQINTALRSR